MNAAPATALRGEIETPRPLRAAAGHVELTGWCLDGDRVPAVRLVTATATLPATTYVARPDFGGATCGFTITGQLPAGIHLAHFEAQRADGTWETFRRYSLRVDPAPLAIALEWPQSTGTVTDRVRFAGWAVHPRHPLRSLSLRFGHQDVPCDRTTARADVAALFPLAPHARDGGFITREKLPAGHGQLRLRATLADGSVTVARTDVTVSIAADENTPASLDLAAPRVGLPRHARPPAAPAAPTAAHPLNVLIVLPGNFAANNSLQATALADELAAAGHRCAVAVSCDKSTVAIHAAPRFTPLTHAEAATFRFADGRPADVIHAWTTREIVRLTATTLQRATGARLVVHLEDNEQQILALTVGRSAAELEQLPDAELNRLITPDLSHPRRAREFLTAADGLTLITARLREFAPVAARCLTLWPAADARYFFPRPRPDAFRALLGFGPDTTVLFYPGNVHAANAAEVRELYAAVARLNESGVPVRLIRAGVDAVDFLGAHATRAREHVIELGPISHHRHVPELMALADILVQPGVPDAFNDYRFPSKLPEFFALGRPVVLPRTNLGEKARHGVDAYVLERADAAGIVRAVRELRADPALAARLAEGAQRFSAEHLSWRRSAESLAKFYAALAPS